jgi:type IV pilus assembly protein PilE
MIARGFPLRGGKPPACRARSTHAAPAGEQRRKTEMNMRFRGFAPPARAMRGITLIELMVVVVIVAILSTIAYPQYRNYIVRSNRTVGKSALADAAARQERRFSDFNAYTADMTQLNYAANPFTTERNLYSVSVDAPTAACPVTSCFALTATAIDPQKRDDPKCQTLTLNSKGQKGSTHTGGGANAAPDPCWE